MSYTPEHPERVDRLVTLGALPTLSTTAPPAPMRAFVSMEPGRSQSAAPPPSRETVIGSMAMMEEAQTIVLYPDNIDVVVAAAGRCDGGR